MKSRLCLFGTLLAIASMVAGCNSQPEGATPTKVSVSLDAETLTIDEGKSGYLVATTVIPDDAPDSPDMRVTWSTNDEEVAWVEADDGWNCAKILARHEGTVVITATTVSGGLTASCTVTVGPKPLAEGEYQGMKWRLDKKGVLTTVGMIQNFNPELEKQPWYAHRLKIKSVAIGKGRYPIGNNAFAECTNLVSVSIPEGIHSIGKGTFSKCEALREIKIPYCVVSIGDHAFSGCSALRSVTIERLKVINPPGAPLHIGEYAFFDCGRLSSFTIPDVVKTISECMFMCCPLEEITIPEGVESVGKMAFYDCSKLKSVTIAASVNRIDERAFQKCYALADVTIMATVPPALEWRNFSAECYTLHVPAGLVDVYKADKAWSTAFTNIVKQE